MGGFYSEVALQKREAEGTVRTKHQLNLDPNPEGTQKNLDDRRYGGREEQRIPHVGGGAGAAQGVTGHLRALGDRTGSTVTNVGASLPEGPRRNLKASSLWQSSPIYLNQRSVRRWAMMKRRRRNSPCIRPEVDMTQGRKARPGQRAGHRTPWARHG